MTVLSYRRPLPSHVIFLKNVLGNQFAGQSTTAWNSICSAQLHSVRLRPVIVHHAGQVQEGPDAVQVGAHRLEVPLPPDALLGTPMSREVVSVHLLTVVAGTKAGGVGGPAEGGGDEGQQQDGDEQKASQ